MKGWASKLLVSGGGQTRARLIVHVLTLIFYPYRVVLWLSGLTNLAGRKI